MFGIKLDDWIYVFIGSLGCGLLCYLCMTLEEIRILLKELIKLRRRNW